MSESNWVVYLLRCGDGTYYCGSTNNLPRRLLQHNGLRSGGARYTATRRPVDLIGRIAVNNRSEAFRLEAIIKKMPRCKKPGMFAHNARP